MKKLLAFVALLSIVAVCGGCSSGSDDGIAGDWSIQTERTTGGTLAEQRSGTATLSVSGDTVDVQSEGTFTLLPGGRTGTYSSAMHFTLDGSVITVPAQETTFYRDGVAVAVSITGGDGTFADDRIEIQMTTVSQELTHQLYVLMTR